MRTLELEQTLISDYMYRHPMYHVFSHQCYAN